MKTALVLLFFLASSASSFCQTCNFFKEEKIDEISGLSVLIQDGKHININRIGSWDVNFFYSTNRCWIHLNIMIKKSLFSNGLNFTPETPIVFFFNDSSVFSLSPPKEYRLEIECDALHSLTSEIYNVIYNISKEEVGILATKTIDRIKIFYLPSTPMNVQNDSIKSTLQYKENHPSSYGSKQIQKLSKCILEVNYLLLISSKKVVVINNFGTAVNRFISVGRNSGGY